MAGAVEQWEDVVASRYEVSPCISWETKKWPLKPLFNVLGMEEINHLGLG